MWQGVLDPEEKAQVWVLAPAVPRAGMWTRPSYGQSVLPEAPRPVGSNGMNGCESAPHTLKCVIKKQRGLLIIIITVDIFGLGAKKNWTLDIPSMTWQGHLRRRQGGSAVLRDYIDIGFHFCFCQSPQLSGSLLPHL